MVEAVETVAAIVGTGAVQGLSGQAAIDLVNGIRKRIRDVFGHDQRAVEALENASGQSDPATLAELTAALRWYAERDQEFSAELNNWAEHGKASVIQHVRAQRDSYTAARDQTVIRINTEGLER